MLREISLIITDLLFKDGSVIKIQDWLIQLHRSPISKFHLGLQLQQMRVLKLSIKANLSASSQISQYSPTYETDAYWCIFVESDGVTPITTPIAPEDMGIMFNGSGEAFALTSAVSGPGVVVMEFSSVRMVDRTMLNSAIQVILPMLILPVQVQLVRQRLLSKVMERLQPMQMFIILIQLKSLRAAIANWTSADPLNPGASTEQRSITITKGSFKSKMTLVLPI